MKFRATSYAEGKIVAAATVEASGYAAVRVHPDVLALPAAARGDRGKIKAIGIKVLR